MKTYYHATDVNNLASILNTGLEARNPENIVYMTEKPDDALKFVALRFYPEILVVKIKIPKKLEHKVIETFDHNPNFFKCRAFGYQGDIPTSMIEPYYITYGGYRGSFEDSNSKCKY